MSMHYTFYSLSKTLFALKTLSVVKEKGRLLFSKTWFESSITFVEESYGEFYSFFITLVYFRKHLKPLLKEKMAFRSFSHKSAFVRNLFKTFSPKVDVC